MTRDDLLYEKVWDWGINYDEHKAVEHYRVSFVNDHYDDSEIFDDLESAEIFAEAMQADGYETEIERAA